MLEKNVFWDNIHKYERYLTIFRGDYQGDQTVIKCGVMVTWFGAILLKTKDVITDFLLWHKNNTWYRRLY